MSRTANLGVRSSLLALLLIASPVSAQTDYFWNTPSGGNGDWDISNPTWSNAVGGPLNHTWLNSSTERANFGHTSGTVRLDSNGITAYGVNFLTTGYRLNGGTLTLAGTGGSLIDTGTGITATIDSAVSGTVGLTKTGVGVLTLGGASTYTGATTVSAGTLGVAPSGTLALSSDFTLASGSVLDLASTNQTIGSLAGAGNVDLGSGRLTLGGSNATTIYTGVIAGTGTVTKTGTGEFRVEGIGTASYTFGKLVVNQGLYLVGSTSGTAETGFGAAPTNPLADAITLDGGAIGAILGVTMNANRGITLGPAGGTIDTTESSMVIPGVISGAGALTSRGAGSEVLTLGGTNTYGGTTTVSGGTLAISNDSALGTTAGGTTVATGATLLIGSALTVPEAITLNGLGFRDLGALRKTGLSTTTLTGAIVVGNGGALIRSEGGTLVITTGGVSGIGDLFVGGTGTMTITAPISSVNKLVKDDSGTLTLGGNNSYTTGTLINAGRVLVNDQTGSNSGTGTGPVAVNGGILGGTGRVAGPVTVATGARVQGGDGTAAGQTLTLGTNLVIADNGGIRVDVRNGSASGDTTPAGAGLVDVNGILGREFDSGTIRIDLNLIGGLDEFNGTQYTRRVLTFDSLSNLAPGTYSSGGPFALTGENFSLDPDWHVIVDGGGFVNVQFSIAPVPEPASILAAGGIGLAALTGLRKARRSRGCSQRSVALS